MNDMPLDIKMNWKTRNWTNHMYSHWYSITYAAHGHTLSVV